MRMSYDAQINNNKDNKKQIFHYEKSYDLGYWCPITGILYGGSCWMYLGYPNMEHISNISNDAKTKLDELLGKNNWEIQGFPVMDKKDWSNSRETFLLNGDIPIEKKIEVSDSTKASSDNKDLPKITKAHRRSPKVKTQKEIREERLRKFFDTNPQFDSFRIPAAVYNEVKMGMPKELVYILLGYPNKVNKTVFQNHTSEQLVYDNKYIYLDNDQVTTIQSSY